MHTKSTKSVQRVGGTGHDTELQHSQILAVYLAKEMSLIPTGMMAKTINIRAKLEKTKLSVKNIVILLLC